MRKVYCLYNQYFFEHIYKYMLKFNIDTIIDSSSTVWHILDVKRILIEEFGYELSTKGVK